VAYKHFFVGRKLQQHITDASQALAEYRVAIEACPDIFMIQLNAGTCFLSLKKYQEARTCFGRAAELSPKNPLPQSSLCVLEYYFGEYAKGIETGMRAVALLGSATLGITQADAHNNLALCLWKSERRAEALEHINKAIAHNPQNLLIRQNLQAIQATKPLELSHTTPALVRLVIIGLVVIIFTIFVLKR
jgi:tetratricopeptide (TPR) repeat protein